MQSNLLQKLYIEELRDLYSAENQLLKALPKMAKAASASDLREGFEEHLDQTKEHVERLEKIFEDLDESPKGKTCKGMEGLIKEGSELNYRGLVRLRKKRNLGKDQLDRFEHLNGPVQGGQFISLQV